MIIMVIMNYLQYLSPLETFMLLSSILPSFITLIMGSIRFFSQKLIGLKKHILLLTFLSFVSSFITMVLWLNVTNNMYIGNIYTLLEALLLFMVYKEYLGKIFSDMFFVSIVSIFCAFFLFNILYIQGFYEINSYSRTLESMLMIFFSLLYFYQVMQTLDSENLMREPMFWLNSGVLLYFSANVFIFIFSSFVSKYSIDLNLIIWAIHSLFHTIFFIMLSTALWVVPQHKQQ